MGIQSGIYGESYAGTHTLTDSGKSIRFPDSTRFNLVGNPVNQNQLSNFEVFSAVTRVLQRWQKASGGAAQFDYWQGTKPGVYETSMSWNGYSNLFFGSNSINNGGLDPFTVGRTEVWFDPQSGEILEADIVLNDVDYRFTTDPRSTSGSGSQFGSSNQVFIENILAHEIGHAFGIAHSAELNSTMLFIEGPEQARLSCGEVNAIRTLYDSVLLEGTGTIIGTVLDSNGEGFFGAQVQAISRRRGVVLASALTNENGLYTIKGLEPGDYHIMIEPYLPGSNTLSPYYQSMQLSVCSSQPFNRKLILDSNSNYLNTISLSANGLGVAPASIIGCDIGNGLQVSQSLGSSAMNGATDLQVDAKGAKSFVDRGQSGESKWYRLSGVQGKLEIRVLSYSLYSPIQVTSALYDSNAQQVSSQSNLPVYVGESGFENRDSILIAENLPFGDYYIELTIQAVGSLLYPGQGAIQLLDTTPFFVATVSLNQPSPSHEDRLDFNARCLFADQFSPYVSPPGDPPQGRTQESGGCGGLTLHDVSGDSQGPGNGMMILSWLLPFALAWRLRLTFIDK